MISLLQHKIIELSSTRFRKLQLISTTFNPYHIWACFEKKTAEEYCIHLIELEELDSCT